MPENILVHSCCAPCAVAVNKELTRGPLKPHLFFYNPNIHPEKEYLLRRQAIQEYSEITGYPLIANHDYAPQVYFDRLTQEAFQAFINQTIDQDSGRKRRCQLCYDTRIEATAALAAKEGFPSFTTTLLYSIYQNHDLIRAIAQEKAEKYRVRFHYVDFRDRWQEGRDLSKEMGLYQQKYCGCLYSWYEKERALQDKKNSNRSQVAMS